MIELSKVLTMLENVRRQAQASHWNVKGPNFGELHSLFGEIYDYANEQIDVYAERMLALDPSTGIKVETEFEQKVMFDPKANIDALIVLLGQTSISMEGMYRTTDPATSNMLQETVVQLDKFVWKLSASR